MPITSKRSTKSIRRTKRFNQYDDPTYNYLNYWEGRDYEHAAEAMAIEHLLKHRHFKEAIDIGGGFGRLSPLLERYANHVVLAEPSQQQLDRAKQFLRGHHAIDRRLMQANDLQFGDGSIDLVLMVRVLNHLPKPSAELREIARVLSDSGYAIIEVANHIHFLNRLRYLIRGRRLPVKAVDIRSPEHRGREEIPFVNHNPQTLIRQMEHAGLVVVRTLSVSNLRHRFFKKFLPIKLMLLAEHILQSPLAFIYFGPSTFFLVRRAKR